MFLNSSKLSVLFLIFVAAGLISCNVPCPKAKVSKSVPIDPTIPCLPADNKEPTDDRIFHAGATDKPTAQCKKCSLDITSDNTAVIVNCVECVDLPFKTKYRSSYDIAYLVYFLQIGNYTADKNDR